MGDVADLVAPGLQVLFVGINPGLRSGATGTHFAGPSNRFWAALHGAGLTDRRLSPGEGDALLAAGLGITNLVERTTATAAEIGADELRAGAVRLEGTVVRFAPRAVAVLGLGAYRTAFGRPRATAGLQPETLGARPLWLFANPSGLQARYQLPDLVAGFEALRRSLD